VPPPQTLLTISPSALLQEKENSRLAPLEVAKGSPSGTGVLIRGVVVITKPWRKLTAFFLYVMIAIGLGISAVMSEERSLASRLLLIVLGLISWSLGEYLLHRFALHCASHVKSLQSAQTMHLVHHDDPQGVEQLFLSPRICLPTATGYCLLTWAILGNWQSMAFLFIGAITGYFCYEWLHYQAHHGHSSLRMMKYLKKYHLLHHGETPNLRFGVTSPLFDYLFGTFQSVSNHR
jgi:dihydroceramide fatty acyl 2-hydroxylase